MKPVVTILNRMSALAAGVACQLAFLSPLTLGAAPQTISFVISDDTAKPIQHGLGKLKRALQEQGAQVEEQPSVESAIGDAVVVAGLSSETGEVAKLMAELRLTLSKAPESLLIRKVNRKGQNPCAGHWNGRARVDVWVAGRGRARGLGESRRITSFSEVRDTAEKPYTPDRALSIYTFNRAYWESRFYDEAYWVRYLDMLARNRFNSLVVIFGYENGGFLAPCYPYFFDVKGFPDVRMVGITPEQQQRNLTALNRLIQWPMTGD